MAADMSTKEIEREVKFAQTIICAHRDSAFLVVNSVHM